MLGPLETLLPGLLGRGVGPVGGLAPRPMGPRGGLRLVPTMVFLIILVGNGSKFVINFMPSGRESELREVETGLSTWEWTRLLLKMHFRSLSRSFLSWVE